MPSSFYYSLIHNTWNKLRCCKVILHAYSVFCLVAALCTGGNWTKWESKCDHIRRHWNFIFLRAIFNHHKCAAGLRCVTFWVCLAPREFFAHTVHYRDLTIWSIFRLNVQSKDLRYIPPSSPTDIICLYPLILALICFSFNTAWHQSEKEV